MWAALARLALPALGRSAAAAEGGAIARGAASAEGSALKSSGNLSQMFKGVGGGGNSSQPQQPQQPGEGYGSWIKNG